MICFPSEAQTDWVKSLTDAGIVPPGARRIIIDIAVYKIPTVYYEAEADERMFTVDLTKALSDAEVIGIADMEEAPDGD